MKDINDIIRLIGLLLYSFIFQDLIYKIIYGKKKNIHR